MQFSNVDKKDKKRKNMFVSEAENNTLKKIKQFIEKEKTKE